MRALMYVDFQLAKKQLGRGLLLAVFFAVMIMVTSIMGGPNEGLPESIGEIQASVMMMVTLMMGMMLMFGVFGPDEAGGWPETRLSLPVTKREVVRARYALMVLLAVVTAVFGGIGCLVVEVAGRIVGNGASSGLSPLLAVGFMALSACVLMLFFSIFMPIVFRWGITTARYSLMLFWLIPVIASVGPVNSFLEGVGASLDALPSPMYLAVGFCVVSIVLYLVSMLVAERLYASREL